MIAFSGLCCRDTSATISIFDDCFDSRHPILATHACSWVPFVRSFKNNGVSAASFCTLSKRYKTLPGQGVGLQCLSWNHSPTTSHNPIRFQLRFFNYDERRDSNISLWQASDECRCPIWSYTIGSSVFLFSSNAFSCHASCICFWRRAASAASFHEFNRS